MKRIFVLDGATMRADARAEPLLTRKPLDAHRPRYATVGRKRPDQAKEFFVRGHTDELHRESGS